MSWLSVAKRSLAATPRSIFVAGIVLATLLAAVIVITSLRGGQGALFAAPLHSDQLDEVEQRLAEWNVPFTPLSDNVLVNIKGRNALLLRLSFAGVPHSHIESSSDLLAKVGALTPQTIVDEQKRNGLAADLELALRGIEGVDDASVIIAPAKPAMYADESARDATASVRLHLHPGARLPPNSVAGIRSFIAAGVPDLSAKNVTILDDRGIALRDDVADANAEDLQASIQSALDQTFGSGITIARFSALSDGSGPPFRLRRSMVVLVDQHRVPRLDEVSAVAGAAGGFDFHRGDRLEVQAVHFADRPSLRRAVWLAVAGSALTIAPTIVVCLALLIGLRIGIHPAASIVKTLLRSSTIARNQQVACRFAPSQVRGVLRDEPPHTAAAIISALPAATAAAVLDLYPADERAAIIRRMSREQSPLLPDVESLISHA